jgi:hypothetical protein
VLQLPLPEHIKQRALPSLQMSRQKVKLFKNMNLYELQQLKNSAGFYEALLGSAQIIIRHRIHRQSFLSGRDSKLYEERSLVTQIK